MSKILIISQGGRATSSFETGQYVPETEGFKAYLDWIRAEKSKDFDFKSISEDVGGENTCHPKHCNELAKIIEDNYDQYDGFFILRGPLYSDYVGASLTFALRGNHKPILIGDAEGSFTNPISNVESFILRGVHYLSTLGQTLERKSDVCLLSDNLIVRAIDATLFPDGTMRYYSRTGQNLHVEQLYAVPDSDEKAAPRNDLKRVHLNEGLNIPLIDGVHGFGEDFKIAVATQPDAIVMNTTILGRINTPDRSGSTYNDIYKLMRQGVPTIFTNKLPHGGVRTPFSDWIVSADTMSTAIALAKTRYALTIADGNMGDFRSIMLEDMHGEMPNETALITAKRPEAKHGSRARI